MARELSTTTRTVTVGYDEEHNASVLQIEDRTAGYPRRHAIGVDLATSAEYRALQSSFGDDDIKLLDGPMLVSTISSLGTETNGKSEEVEEEGGASADATSIGGAPIDRSMKLAAEPRADEKSQDVQIDSIDGLVEFFISAGKRGVAVNRYKGLGEMNPDQLWETTMKPEARTLLQVRAEDDAEADLMFTTLMGDHVEPRRKFIEDNALSVQNLDV